MYSRISKKQYYLEIAKAVAQRSTCLKRQYGAVIVSANDEIIATGYNGAPRGYNNCTDNGFCPRMNVAHNTGDYGTCSSVHAEQNAMLSAARKDMIGGTLYLVGRDNGNWFAAEPCPICNRMIQNSGIKNTVTIKEELYSC